MKQKLLVANRSEIACRVFQTCREMGIHSIGIAAPGDEDARHLTYADEVQPVSGYLNINSVIEAARKSGAKLIHPGYGFLSERPEFVEAVEKAGCTFVGPRAETMRLMGGKIQAKEFASNLGIPVLPWGKVQRGEDILSTGDKIGYPLLLKASAGGGGKGMRLVNRREDLRAAAESASAEAMSAFGDGTLFLERLVKNPRHIEVQVFGDGKGGGTHLHERECSLQRRHQKIWEEATAPHLSSDAREGLFDAAMRLVKASRYGNAGTLEFLVDDQERFYFLEMNTRLQVEHPVTEFVTGVDLVWAQISQALAPHSTILAEPPPVQGHAIEVRLYAEDPAQGFIPTPGKVERLKWPTGIGIRVESGIEEGQVVGTQFDSMLAKLIVHAHNRNQALQRMKFALEETVILGLGTNQGYLRSLLDHPQVREGRVSTAFLEKEAQLLMPALSEEDQELLCAAQDMGWSHFSSSRIGMGIATGNSHSEIRSPWQAFKDLSFGGKKGRSHE